MGGGTCRGTKVFLGGSRPLPLLCWVGCLFCLLAALQEADASGRLVRRTITNARQRGALCLQGEDYQYYVSENGDPTRWLLYLQSGNYCRHAKHCRSAQGSKIPQHIEALDILSSNATENPTFAEFRRAYLPYCSQDLWLGQGYHDGLYFHGRTIFQSVAEDILSTGNVEEVVLVGSGVGGIGVLNQVPFLLALLPSTTRLRIIVDSAWLVDLGATRWGFLENISLDLFNATALPQCNASFNSQLACCLQPYCMVAYFIPQTVPVFALQSQYDLLPLHNLDPSDDDNAILNLFYVAGTTNFTVTALQPFRPNFSFFLPGCVRHQYFLGSGFTCSSPQTSNLCDFDTTVQRVDISWDRSSSLHSLLIDDTSLADALQLWYNRTAATTDIPVRLTDMCDGPVCNPTCPEEVAMQVGLAVFDMPMFAVVAFFAGFFIIAFVAALVREQVYLVRIRKAYTSVREQAKALPPPAKLNHPLYVFCENLTVIAAGTTTILLDKVTAEILPGKLIGIMGPSGCGKTTMITCLAGRGNPRMISPGSTIQVNFRDMYDDTTRASYLDRVAFVAQLGDVLMDRLTVLDTLLYSAVLRLGRDHPDIHVHILSALRDTNLLDCTQKRVGELSGGQRKRLAVACELLSSPSILFLDEPTSGLDASNSLALVSALARLVKRRGCSVVMTIHQPRTEIFEMIDEVILFAVHGKLIYQGAPNAAINEVTPEVGSGSGVLLKRALSRTDKHSNVSFVNAADVLLDRLADANRPLESRPRAMSYSRPSTPVPSGPGTPVTGRSRAVTAWDSTTALEAAAAAAAAAAGNSASAGTPRRGRHRSSSAADLSERPPAPHIGGEHISRTSAALPVGRRQRSSSAMDRPARTRRRPYDSPGSSPSISSSPLAATPPSERIATPTSSDEIPMAVISRTRGTSPSPLRRTQLIEHARVEEVSSMDSVDESTQMTNPDYTYGSDSDEDGANAGAEGVAAMFAAANEAVPAELLQLPPPRPHSWGRYFSLLPLLVSRFTRGYGPRPIVVQLATVLLSGALVGVILQGDYNAFTVAAALWLCLMVPGFVLNSGTVIAFCWSWLMHQHEVMHRLYFPSQIVLLHFLYQSVVAIVVCVELVALVYWLVYADATVERFIFAMLTCFAATWLWVALFIAVSAMFKGKFSTANDVAATVVLVSTFLSGYFVPVYYFLSWLGWLPFLSPFYWGFSALTVTSLEDQDFPSSCDSDSKLVCELYSGSSMVLYFGYVFGNFTVGVGVLVAATIVFVLLAWLFTRFHLNRASSR